ncbi:MAG: hypothetical protein SFV54_27115 [Bryobacteraceae bacterium]|nr:hypothetical protein [Bryobacteraceae bacterium]
MKDLFVYTADLDALAFIKAILVRPAALGIREIAFDIDHFSGRDSGMVKEGPEIARSKVRKNEYGRLVLTWDRHGSGWEGVQPEVAAERVQKRLDSSSWSGCSCAIVADPEIEEWLWSCQAALAAHLKLTPHQLSAYVPPIAEDLGYSPKRCLREHPKEVFEELLYRCKRRGPLPEDFARNGDMADIKSLESSPSFHNLASALRRWFPLPETSADQY